MMQRTIKKARGGAPMAMHMMMPNMMMGGMMPQMPFMPPMQQPNMFVEEEDSEEPVVPVVPAKASSNPPPPQDPSDPQPEDGQPVVHQRLADGLISRSCTYVKQLPRNRLSECLEALEPALDASYTAELSSQGLLSLLWLFCRIKPAVKISDLRSLMPDWYNFERL